MMRLLGRMEPDSGAGGAGHLASCRRPNATVDANAAESCFFRPVRRPGAAVSGATTGLAATESTPLPSGGGAAPGVASRPALHDVMIGHAKTATTRRTTLMTLKTNLGNPLSFRPKGGTYSR